jgi:DNA-binding GntR family transcriptional regulator
MLDRSGSFSTPTLPKPAGLAAFARDRLRDAIIACELTPGATVSEPELAQHFGLGRAAVRQATAFLAAEGLLTARPRHGWQVKPVTGAGIGDLVRARRQIDIAMAAAKPTAPALNDAALVISSLLGRGDSASLLAARRADRSFMTQLAALAGPYAAAWIAELQDESDRIRLFLERLAPQVAKQPVADRQALLTALQKGDTAAATALLLQEITAFERFCADCLMAVPAELNSRSQPKRRERVTAAGTSPRAASHQKSEPRS